VIVLVIRTRQPFFKSMPGRYLLGATLLVVGLTVIFPYTPLAGPFNFQPLPPEFLLMLGLILILYITAAEVVKRFFYRRLR
jgi:Mg2+-importing ATPase